MNRLEKSTRSNNRSIQLERNGNTSQGKEGKGEKERTRKHKQINRFSTGRNPNSGQGNPFVTRRARCVESRHHNDQLIREDGYGHGHHSLGSLHSPQHYWNHGHRAEGLMPHNRHPGYRSMPGMKLHHHPGHRPKARLGIGRFHGQALGLHRLHPDHETVRSTQSLRQQVRALEDVVLGMSRRLKSLERQLHGSNK